MCAGELKDRLGKDFEKLPPGAIGVYSYMQRLAQGMRQLMAGCRKFTLDSLTRGDLCSLTKECAEISGIPHVMDLDEVLGEPGHVSEILAGPEREDGAGRRQNEVLASREGVAGGVFRAAPRGRSQSTARLKAQ